MLDKYEIMGYRNELIIKLKILKEQGRDITVAYLKTLSTIKAYNNVLEYTLDNLRLQR